MEGHTYQKLQQIKTTCLHTEFLFEGPPREVTPFCMYEQSEWNFDGFNFKMHTHDDDENPDEIWFLISLDVIRPHTQKSIFRVRDK